jgi:hypothetical protein
VALDFVASISEELAASIFRVEVSREGERMFHKISSDPLEGEEPLAASIFRL